MKELNDLLARLEKLHPKYIDLSLKRIKILLEKLGNPHLNLPPCIHIAGTNGKGSTLSFIKHILMESNYKVHAYTSPHLTKINERFFISNKIISNKKLFKYLKYIEKINNKKSITFYEITTATAFYLFSKYKADFLLLETGLGGRLDATNIITNSLISIITPISLDHKEYLGRSIKKITNEKLGIIKKSSVIISSKQTYRIAKQINNYAKKNKHRTIMYGKNWILKKTNNNLINFQNNKKLIKFSKPSLEGDHQIYNASTALATIYYLQEVGYNFKKNDINKAIVETQWPGRLENIKKNNPSIYIDGAHNIDGANALKNFIIQSNKKTWIVLGILKTKEVYLYLKALKKSIIGVIAIDIPNEKNSLSPEEIKKCCEKINIFCKTEKNVKNAIKKIVKNYNPQQIIITGSLYLIGKTRKKLLINY